MDQVFAEAYRLRLMRGLEDAFGDAGIQRIAGVDEAGRGCLAGPVVAGAVIVEGGILVPGVDDSKALKPEQRRRLAEAIRRAHPASAVASASPETIDRINILEATRLAMERALGRLPVRPELALVDAVRLRADVPCLPVIRGDQISYAVACASILAKVERDRIMTDLHRSYPQYDFAGNKGYGSAAHRRALAVYGPCEAHRLTFRSVLPRAEGTRRKGTRRRAAGAVTRSGAEAFAGGSDGAEA